MRIALLEPFLTGSHKKWAEEFAQHSKHEIKIFSLSGHYWKWRMHGGAVSLARKFLESNFQPDVLLATDMLDLSVFLGLTRSATHNIPSAIYFHENQLTYPWSPMDSDVRQQRDTHYCFINYTSALAADKVFFNSQYHFDSFFKELPVFLKAFPDNNESGSVENIKKKSSVLPLGMDLEKIQQLKPAEIKKEGRAVILWNHRWEYDKNPEAFFHALFELKERGVEFKLVVLGESYESRPKIFDEAREKLKENILHFGFAQDYAEYVQWLCKCDILPVTSVHDFFGTSVVEAMYCDVFPLLPKRLAYPEHIPQQLHYTFFYEDNEREFVNRLQRLIFDVKLPRGENVHQFVEQYDWRKMIERYDNEIHSLLR
ncbi:MAG: DUF3524 domain-containing protein [Chitinophagales bacterium]|nr:DUF3524 domain-containing protein [Chitinophagales bacterium]